MTPKCSRITTGLDWHDLVVPPGVMKEIERVTAWLRHSGTGTDEWGLSRAPEPGYRCLFCGPPGTGKTLAATLIGQAVNVDVYRIDLSRVASKYIGETEKNLAKVFDQARSRRWVLFFDEADALFGSRTQISGSHDRYANQEVSYLLQRAEDFPGLVILATNLQAKIDEALVRRFQSVIHFPKRIATEDLEQGIRKDPRRDPSTDDDPRSPRSSTDREPGSAGRKFRPGPRLGPETPRRKEDASDGPGEGKR